MVERQGVLMYLLQRAGVVEGKTRLQKLVFLVQEEQKVSLHYRFKPYHRGPLSFGLQKDVNSLVNQGIVIEYVREFTDVSGEIRKRYDYMLSDLGKAYFDKIVFPILSNNVKKGVPKVVERWNGANINDLLDYVHNKYPDYYLSPAHMTID